MKKYIVIYSNFNEYGGYYSSCRMCEKSEDETFKSMLEREGIYSCEYIIKGENIDIVEDWSGKWEILQFFMQYHTQE